MCGIAGWLDERPERNDAPLAAMLAAMTPRGPDDEGHTEIRLRRGGCLLLGARRLAILDLSPAGHQPMHDPLTGNWVVYNGEIYNFRDLRKELEAHGCVFRSQCDTEVLLHSYRIWGEQMWSRLRGMFAFAIWDEARQALHLVRDRHGIKPLYYWHAPGRLGFASELRALLASGLVPREMDATGLDSLLKFGAVQEPVTLVRGVRLLRAGHHLRWDSRGLHLQAYWKLPQGPELRNGNRSERQARFDELRHTLASAVRMRLVSDVPLGVFLSGGLDSSVVASVAAQGAAHIKTFNINLAEKEFAEGDKARRMAAHLGAEHHEIMLREDELLAGLPGALAAMDQPTVNGINTYFVSAATKQAGVTVALSGLGGDELFAGYRSFRLVPRLERLATWSPAWTRQLAASLLDSRFCPVPHDPRVLAWLRGEDGYAHPFYLSRLLLAPAQVAQLLQPDWLLAIDFGTYAEEFADRRALLERHDAVNRVSCLELSVYLRNTLLRDTDCMSMAHSLEVRVPLIDHLLTEQVLRLPGAWKLDGARRKPLLLAALDRPLPEEIERQPKHGFELPWARWLRGRLRDEVEQTLAEPGSLLGSALRWNGVRRLWQEFLEDRVHWSRPWLFYVLQKWSQQHLAQ